MSTAAALAIDEPPFSCVEDVLDFAFNYASKQSPKNSLVNIGRDHVDGNRPANPNALIGLDAAAQAGMIINELCRLPDEQHNFIVAKWYIVEHECWACEQAAQRKEWREAIEELGATVILEGMHKQLRKKVVEKAIHPHIKLDIDRLSRQYGNSKTTSYRQMSFLKGKFDQIEELAMSTLHNRFAAKGLIPLGDGWGH